jgi:uncharacterized protein YqjF (DUF2071 family)
MARRRPHRRRPSSDLVVQIGEQIPDVDLSELDAFLTRHWRLFSRRGSWLVRAEVGHEAWPLHCARIQELHEGLVSAAAYQFDGLPSSVLYSTGVDVTAGRPRVITRTGDSS